jgi:hypothetical protein
MNQLNVVNYYGLNCGDRLTRQKGLIEEHYGIFCGVHRGFPIVAETQHFRGVRYISLEEFLLWGVGKIEKVDAFPGTEKERKSVVPKVNELLGSTYNMANFNKDHFTESTEKEKASGDQVTAKTIVGLGLLALIGLAFSDL